MVEKNEEGDVGNDGDGDVGGSTSTNTSHELTHLLTSMVSEEREQYLAQLQQRSTEAMWILIKNTLDEEGKRQRAADRLFTTLIWGRDASSLWSSQSAIIIIFLWEHENSLSPSLVSPLTRKNFNFSNTMQYQHKHKNTNTINKNNCNNKQRMNNRRKRAAESSDDQPQSGKEKQAKQRFFSVSKWEPLVTSHAFNRAIQTFRLYTTTPTTMIQPLHSLTTTSSITR